LSDPANEPIMREQPTVTTLAAASLLLIALLACKKDPPPPPPAEPAPAALANCPNHERELGGNGTGEFTCTCGAGSDKAGTVWGDSLYTTDSNPCTAAVHAGVIPATGGTISLKEFKGCDRYLGTTKNGVTTSSWASWGGSFYFPSKTSAPACAAGVCPSSFSGKTGELSCDCPAGSATGTVWGSGIYTTDSSVCAAALHAGVITIAGGSVTATSAPGCNAYKGTTANGVTTRNWGKYATSFYFPSKGSGTCQ
jgi:hypothetical protein